MESIEKKMTEIDLIGKERNNINKECKEYENIDGFYLKIYCEFDSLKLVIYNIEKLDGIKYQLIQNLHELNSCLKNENNIKAFYNKFLELIENKKCEIKNGNDSMKLIILYKNNENKEKKIEFQLIKENKELNEFNNILLHEISKLKNDNNELIRKMKQENETIRKDLHNIMKKINNNKNYEIMNFNKEETEINIYDKNYGNDIFKFLKKIENLKELRLYNDNINDISGLNLLNLDKLKILGLNDNKISEINIINKLDSLEELWLSNNKINNIDFLEKINTEKLKKLDLSMNYLTDISTFQKINLINLNELLLYKNKIKDIKIFENSNLLNLKKLDLSLNNIGDINVFISDKNIFKILQELDLSHNQITNINCFQYIKYNYLYQYIKSSKLNALSILNLSYNHIDISKNNYIIQYLHKKLNLKIKYQNL